jgi:sulfite exporter TauE/SafE
MQFLTPFLIGLFSGFHCVAMCGGMCALICQKQSSKVILITNIGRVITYVFLGCIFAGIIQGASLQLDLAFIGIVLRTLMGISLIFLGLSIFIQAKSKLLKIQIGLPLWKQASSQLNKLKNNNSSSAFLFKGMLWGFIPCGLLYSLLLVAATTQNITSGGLFMLFFGMGTILPLLISQELFKQLQQFISLKIIRTSTSSFIIIMGIWILLSPWYAQSLIPQDNPFFASIAAVLNACIP